MPAELSLHRFGNCADLHRHYGIFKGLYHLTRAEPSQFTAVRTGRAGGFCLGQFREIGTVLQFFDQGFRLILGFHQNMRGVIFLACADIGVFRVKGGFHGLFGHGGIGGKLQHFARFQGAAFVFQRQAHQCGIFLWPGLHQ